MKLKTKKTPKPHEYQARWKDTDSLARCVAARLRRRGETVTCKKLQGGYYNQYEYHTSGVAVSVRYRKQRIMRRPGSRVLEYGATVGQRRGNLSVIPYRENQAKLVDSLASAILVEADALLAKQQERQKAAAADRTGMASLRRALGGSLSRHLRWPKRSDDTHVYKRSRATRRSEKGVGVEVLYEADDNTYNLSLEGISAEQVAAALSRVF